MAKIKRGVSNQPNQPTKIHKDRLNQVTVREILTLYDVEIREGNTTNHITLRVCQWSSNQSVDGQPIPSPVTLEKRRYHKRKDGVIRWGKAMGLTLEDLKVIATNQDAIIKALQ